MHKWNFIGLLLLLGLSSACKTLNSNRILFYKAGSPLTLDSLPKNTGYSRIIPGDVLSVVYYPNQGESKLIGKTDAATSVSRELETYLVDQEGTIRLPMIGKITVQGKTVEEVRNLLTEKLSAYVKEPYVEVRLTNERVMLFPGKGEGKVIQINNQNTSLLEVIALGGGLTTNTKSTEIHLIRKEANGTKTYRFDISELQNLKAAGVYVRNHDIIVVNYYPRKLQGALKEINPWLNLTTTSFAIISIILRFKP